MMRLRGKQLALLFIDGGNLMKTNGGKMLSVEDSAFSSPLSSFVVLAARNHNQKVSWSYNLYRRRYSTSNISIIGLRNFRYTI